MGSDFQDASDEGDMIGSLGMALVLVVFARVLFRGHSW